MIQTWCYFLGLGGNGGRDKWSFTEHRGPSICQCTGRYKDAPVIDRKLLRELVDELSHFGINMVVLDVLDALQYSSHPEISLEGAFTHEELRAELAYMREHGIDRIVKGYRGEADLPWEREQAEYNRKHGGYETELILCKDNLRHVSSTLVRKKITGGESIIGLVPPAVADYIETSMSRKDENNED